MNIKELRSILEKENIWKYAYSLSENEPPMCETTLCLHKKKNGVEYYTSERNIVRDKITFNNENDACRSFLEDMASSYPALKKYINDD